MKLAIILVLKTEKTEAALTVVLRLNKVISAELLTLEKYEKVGIKAFLEKEISEIRWPDAILAALTTAQSFGRSWTIIGNAEEELNLVGNSFSLSGIEWAEVSLLR